MTPPNLCSSTGLHLFCVPSVFRPAEIGAVAARTLRDGRWPDGLYDSTEWLRWAALLAERGGAAPAELLALVLSELEQLGGHSDHTLRRMGMEMAFLVRHLDHLHVRDVRDISSDVVKDFIDAAVRSGRSWVEPSLSTRYLRRSASRMYFKTARRLGLEVGDPVEALALPPRSAQRARPLTDEEIVECRQASRRTLMETRLPASLALAEATACASERGAAVAQDLDLENHRVWLHDGGRGRAPRWGSLSEWGVGVLARRAEDLNGRTSSKQGLVYTGLRGGSSAEASASSALFDVLSLAGLAREPGVTPASVAAWAGVKVFERTGGDIAAVAKALGLTKLDTAASVIGWDWRGEK